MGTTPNRIKHHAFMPKNGEVSVIRCKDCPKDCILKIGHNTGIKSERHLKAVSSVMADKVRSINNLDIKPDTGRGQHRRHANIEGFRDYADAKILRIAQKLANEAHLLYVI